MTTIHERSAGVIPYHTAGDQTLRYLVLHSATPESWAAVSSPLLADLAPGRPLHAETWSHLFGLHGLRSSAVYEGGEDHRIAPVGGANPDAGAINAAIEVVNRRLLGPGEYVLVAVRER